MSVALNYLLTLPNEDASAEVLAKLLALAKDEDAEVRSLTAVALVRFAPNADAADALIGLAQDADALVRTQALDSLAAFPTEKVLACLTAALARETAVGLSYRYALLTAAEVAVALRQAGAGAAGFADAGGQLRHGNAHLRMVRSFAVWRRADV